MRSFGLSTTWDEIYRWDPQRHILCLIHADWCITCGTRAPVVNCLQQNTWESSASRQLHPFGELRPRPIIDLSNCTKFRFYRSRGFGFTRCRKWSFAVLNSVELYNMPKLLYWSSRMRYMTVEHLFRKFPSVDIIILHNLRGQKYCNIKTACESTNKCGYQLNWCKLSGITNLLTEMPKIHLVTFDTRNDNTIAKGY
jgi:hypothetical protein